MREKHYYLAGAGGWSWNDVRKKYCRAGAPAKQPNTVFQPEVGGSPTLCEQYFHLVKHYPRGISIHMLVSCFFSSLVPKSICWSLEAVIILAVVGPWKLKPLSLIFSNVSLV